MPICSRSKRSQAWSVGHRPARVRRCPSRRTIGVKCAVQRAKCRFGLGADEAAVRSRSAASRGPSSRRWATASRSSGWRCPYRSSVIVADLWLKQVLYHFDIRGAFRSRRSRSTSRSTSSRCCRALKLATPPSLSMHMRDGVVGWHVDGVVATMTARPQVSPTARLVGVVVRVARQDQETAGCGWPSQKVSRRPTPWPARARRDRRWRARREPSRRRRAARGRNLST